MQHPALLLLVMCLQSPLPAASRPSERHLGLGLHDAFWSEELLPDGFNNYAANIAENATCGNTHAEPRTAPKLETSLSVSSATLPRNSLDLEAVTDVKSPVEKQRRQIPSEDDNDETTITASNAHSFSSEDTGQQAESNITCRLMEGGDCSPSQCREDGSDCQLVNLKDGKPGSYQARKARKRKTLDKDFTQLPRCRQRACAVVKPPEEVDCFMLGVSQQSCLRDQAQRCYDLGARCIVDNSTPTSYCKKFTVPNNAQLFNGWITQACRGCSCSRRRKYKGHGWSNAELSKGLGSVGSALSL